MAIEVVVPKLNPVFDLSVGSGDSGHLLFLGELDERATLGSSSLPVAGAGWVRVDREMRGLRLGPVVSIEIFNPVRVVDPGGDPRRIRFRPVEFVFSEEKAFSVHEGQLSYVDVLGQRFPGLTAGFNEAGFLVWLKVARAGFIGSTVAVTG